MKAILFLTLGLVISPISAQQTLQQADSLKSIGLLMPALEKYMEASSDISNPELNYKIASIYALLWTSAMRDSAFHYLKISLDNDQSLSTLYDPQFLSLVDDPRWEEIVAQQIKRYESENGQIKNEDFARSLFKMIIRDQGYMYVGNIERRKYMRGGGYFSTPAIFPVLAMEEKNLKENISELQLLLDRYGWPTASEVTEIAAAGAALIINHSSYELRSKYFPLLKAAFEKGEAQPLRYAKMQDRLLVEEDKEQLYGTQIEFVNNKRWPYPILHPKNVDQRRAKIGLGSLTPYLKRRFDIDWKWEK